MIHLNTYSISYGQKKDQKSKCQFDSRPLKVTIVLIYLRANDTPHIFEKFLTRATTLLGTSSQSEVYTRNYEPPKWQEF